MSGLHRYTYADYVGVEMYSTTTKYEFFDGEIYAIPGSTAEHSALAASIGAALDNAIGDRPCRVHASSLRLYVEAVGLATYPDGCVICGPLRQHEPSPISTALNPMILVEVTSPASEIYDIGAKLEYYRTIPTLREYLIVSHRERRITAHIRGENDTWITRVAISGGRLEVPSLSAELLIDDIYRNSAIR